MRPVYLFQEREIMADNEQKAEQLVAEAEKKLNAKPFLGTYSRLHCGRAMAADIHLIADHKMTYVRAF